MNDIVIANVVVIPVLWRNGVSGAANALQGMDLTGWDSTFWRLPYWYKQVIAPEPGGPLDSFAAEAL